MLISSYTVVCLTHKQICFSGHIVITTITLVSLVIAVLRAVWEVIGTVSMEAVRQTTPSNRILRLQIRLLVAVLMILVFALVQIRLSAAAVLQTRMTTVALLASHEPERPAKLGHPKLLILTIIFQHILEVALVVDITIAVIQAVIVAEHGATPQILTCNGSIAMSPCAPMMESSVPGGIISHTMGMPVLNQLRHLLPTSVHSLTLNCPLPTVMPLTLALVTVTKI
mmetsp:Transcript_30553/g.45203  ORF Transcript_30553/g.45203 Transcript_30553/m.45203 type:complete len:226 (-) Transcript_30553:242-919(-)